jgi:hypothetical protein
MDRAYHNLEPGFAAWEDRVWDYGGCSTLGDGVLLEVLLLTDEALSHGDLFEREIRAVRADAVEHITGDHSFFPFCDSSTGKPTPQAELEAEVRQILEKVKLTEAERTRLEARLAEGIVGKAFEGG